MPEACQALASKKILLDSGDTDSTCNCAYHAMFDTARSALIASKAPVEPETARTHGGLITAFSLHLVKTGRVPLKPGKALNKTEDTQPIADYKGDLIETSDAERLVGQEDLCFSDAEKRRAVMEISAIPAINCGNSRSLQQGHLKN